MNYFTQLSIDLANQRNYLDQLFSVYPLAPDSIREIDQSVWANVEMYYNNNNNKEMFKELLKLDLFPIKDGYVPYFRRDRSAIDRNPNTVNRICGRIRELGLDKIYEQCTQPKETNRQMGPLFRRWLNSGVLGMQPVDRVAFDSTNDNAILDGSDDELKKYAVEKLGFTREGDKGLDLLCRFNGKYIIGEAKFISDEGGHQNDQFLDVVSTVKAGVNNNVIAIGIVDGILYIPGKKKMYTYLTTHDEPIMSALLLRNFLYSLPNE